MPRGDRTGPDGAGSRTGRGMGFCSGYDTPGYMNSRFGRGGGLGRGFRGGGGWRAGGFGWRNMGFGVPYTPQPVTPEFEKENLKNEAQYLKERIDAINKRIEELGE